MKIVYINSVIYGSTGKIMKGLYQAAENCGIEAYIAYPNFDGKLEKKLLKSIYKNHIIIGNYFDSILSHILGRVFGMNDCFSFIPTLNFIRKLNKIQPDIIHLHNLHNCYINIHLFFRYIKKKKIPIVWTLHDCWAFTAKCPYFQNPVCEKWKKECDKCHQLHKYPKSYVDHTRKWYRLKKKYFLGIEKMMLVSPSQWLSDLLAFSFLSNYDKRVINNGCDLKVFKPRITDFREKYNIVDQFMILGVAQKWEERKGLDVFLNLYKHLDRTKYKIVLVGIKKNQTNIPEGILKIDRTDNQIELAKLYSAADVFFNPTREEAFGLVNIEALACGTPVITFKTGGCPELIDQDSGVVLEENSWQAAKVIMEQVFRKEICFHRDLCVKRAQNYDENLKYMEYIELYKN